MPPTPRNRQTHLALDSSHNVPLSSSQLLTESPERMAFLRVGCLPCMSGNRPGGQEGKRVEPILQAIDWSSSDWPGGAT